MNAADLLLLLTSSSVLCQLLLCIEIVNINASPASRISYGDTLWEAAKDATVQRKGTDATYTEKLVPQTQNARRNIGSVYKEGKIYGSQRSNRDMVYRNDSDGVKDANAEKDDDEDRDDNVIDKEFHSKILKSFHGTKPSKITHVASTVVEHKPNVFIYLPMPVKSRKAKKKKSASNSNSSTNGGKWSDNAYNRNAGNSASLKANKYLTAVQKTIPTSRNERTSDEKKYISGRYSSSGKVALIDSQFANRRRGFIDIKSIGNAHFVNTPVKSGGVLKPASIVQTLPVQTLQTVPSFIIPASLQTVVASQPQSNQLEYLNQSPATKTALIASTAAVQPTAFIRAIPLQTILTPSKPVTASFNVLQLPVVHPSRTFIRPQPVKSSYQSVYIEKKPYLNVGLKQIPTNVERTRQKLSVYYPPRPKKTQTVLTQTQYMPTQTIVYSTTQYTPATRTTVFETDHNPDVSVGRLIRPSISVSRVVTPASDTTVKSFSAGTNTLFGSTGVNGWVSRSKSRPFGLPAKHSLVSRSDDEFNVYF